MMDTLEINFEKIGSESVMTINSGAIIIKKTGDVFTVEGNVIFDSETKNDWFGGLVSMFNSLEKLGVE